MEFIVVDIESTGLAPDINEIIEIGAVRVVPDGNSWKITDRYSQLIKAVQDIPPVVRSLTGISEAMLVNSPRFKEIAEDFLDFIGDGVFVAHNALFDLRTINTSLLRAGHDELKNKMLDTQDIVAIAYPMMPSHRLGDIVQTLKIKTASLHRALADAEATAHVLIRCIETIKALPTPIIITMQKIVAPCNNPIKEIIAAAAAEKIAALSGTELLEIHNWKQEIKPKQRFKKSVYTKETEDETPVDIALIEKFLGKAGALAKSFPGYEDRPQQIEMAKTIIGCLNNDEHLLIEAGTGTGKSAAYLLAALLWIKQNGGPIVISTRTKNLQAQLLDKDIPQLLQLFPEDAFQLMLLKGRNNYVCLKRFELIVQNILLSRSKESYKVLPLLTWLTKTSDGDLSELHSSIEKRYSNQINSEADLCNGDLCPEFGQCFVQHIRRQAKYADCVIANHALVFTDLATESKLLPTATRLILDEAHNIEDSVTEAFSQNVSYGLFVDVLKELDQLVTMSGYQRHSDRLRSDARELFLLFADVIRASIPNTLDSNRALLMSVLRENSAWGSLELIKISISKTITKLTGEIEIHYTDITNDKHLEILALSGRLKKIITVMSAVWETDQTMISWASIIPGKEPYNLVLQAAPVNIGELLQENLFASKQSVILTSATLTVNHTFDYIKQRLGIDRNTEQRFIFHELGSPYNYKEAMLCAMPDDMTFPAEKEYILHLAEFLTDVFTHMQGRTLVLFTSYNMMERTYRIARELAGDHGINILCQGTHGSRRSLVSRFKSTQRTVLFGTSSFWEGVDIQGEALSCVVIVKLPFAVPTDPIVQARAEYVTQNGGNAFMDYSVPQAVIKFKQGVGRLIRSHNDRGVVMLIDERVFTKQYGKAFLKSLPDCTTVKASREKILERIEQWMGK